MNILIVEDDVHKLRNIVATLTSVDGISLSDIETCTDANAAKAILRRSAVDLLIVDLHIPDRADLAPTAGGGLDFVRSLISRPSFFVPTYVVTISGNAEAVATAGDDTGELWGIINYDSASETWRNQLRGRVRYILSALNSIVSRPRKARACDIALVTALDDELSGVLQLPLDWSSYQSEQDGTTYHEATLQVGAASKRLVAATSSRMGMAATAALSSKIIDLYRPKHMIMTGITGGLRGRVQLGDILIADPSWDWGSGKYEVIEGKPRFSANPDQLRISPDIRPLLIQASKDEELLASIRSSFTGTKPRESLSCYVEAVASGASVLGDEAVVQEIKSQNRKLHGVEMEAYGLMMAAETCSRPRPIAFAAKAVSDFADTTKDDDFRAYAVHVSAQFAFKFIKKYLMRPSELPA
ncbi:hypothetical protein J5N58_20815 [Rhizobium cremeum]|uniref:phosphorylase family protein n=1 Tax=Rhizobium cremeum TaxID=2813827 RepID=UPI001FD359F4|nr:hypothetical protein [Rhizobium cremeum]MCJ7996910.1 hypothetical protein [Rhizobium cremeum]MCJ8002128.1 hypothetical protein [Rhizobium cremeum]